MRTRSILTTAQLALALVLLAGSGLLARSFVRVLRVDPGIRTDHLLTFSMVMTSASYPEAAAVAPAVQQYLDRWMTVPGVVGATSGTLFPMHDDFDRISVEIEGEPRVAGADQPETDRYVVTPDWFNTLGISLVQGRLFSPGDGPAAPPVAVIDELFAHRAFRGTNPIGRRIDVPGHDSLATVVGIVRHVRTYGPEVASTGQIYLSQRQFPFRFLKFGLRTSRDPTLVIPEVRRIALATDARQPVYAVTTMEEQIARINAPRRFALVLVFIFAGVALVLSAVGLYGVVAYAAAQRRREFGIRLALGASPRDLGRLVFGQVARLVVAGVGAGVLVLVAANRVVSGMLYGVGPTDPVVLTGVVFLLVVVVMLASLGPARRAARSDVRDVLRE